MQCSRCNHHLGDLEARVAFISTSVAGDEYTHSYWRCTACGHYSVETYIERFMGTEYALIGPVITPEEGAALIALIGRCPKPNDKHCDCIAHQQIGSDGTAPSDRESIAANPYSTPPDAGTGQSQESPTQASADGKDAVTEPPRFETVKVDRTFYTCPICGQQTDSLKRYGIMCDVVFVGIAAYQRRARYTACPTCMRALVLGDTFSFWTILKANLMWLLAVLPYALALCVATTIPGHSKGIEPAIDESKNA